MPVTVAPAHCKRKVGLQEIEWVINYLKASRLRLCLLLNFGKPRLEIQRIAN